MNSTDIIKILDVLNLLETSHLQRVDFTIDNRKCTAYKVINILRIDIKLEDKK
jgi:hypothetical protein